MQLGRNGFFHLTYCTNIHPGERWDEVAANLRTYLPVLKEQLAPERSFGIGLRLSNQAAEELLQADRLAQFKTWLEAQDLYVFTINGFPYGGFHRQVVKDNVYAPDWRTRERVAYTVRLATILAELVPDGMDGSISTSPISYKPWLDAGERASAFRLGSQHLAEVTADLVRLRERTGARIHVDLEPEPHCLIENTEETVAFFQRWLLSEGGTHLAEQLGVSQREAEVQLLEHVRVCYDTCHLAVEYEEPATVLQRFEDAGIRIGKVQISSALKTMLPHDEREALRERLEPFAESTYLHQVIERRADGSFQQYADLPEALPHMMEPDAREWRIHYHVPIFIDQYGMLAATQDDIVAALEAIRSGQVCSHLEIETYTWDVLPPDLKTDVASSIRREYEWVLSRFED